jgi:excisionase family DNA binding protein
MTSDIMTLTEAAKYIRVSEKTLGELAREKGIPAQKVGREWRFLRQAVEEWFSGKLDSKKNASLLAQDSKMAKTAMVREPMVQYALPFAGFRDTAFTENRDRALHRWVPWIAGFSSTFVDDVLDKIAGETRRRLTVLDPFAGVGTTLVEAMKRGHDAIGFEINPYAALACNAKVRANAYDVRALKERISAFSDHMLAKQRAISASPIGFASRVPFFSPAIEQQALLALDFIKAQKTPWICDLFRVALGSVMVSFSNYSYEPSLGTRMAAGKSNIEDADVTGIIVAKLEEFVEDISFFQGALAAYAPEPTAQVHHGSFFDLAEKVPAESVDTLITSPPYLNNYHYIRNTRPQMFWLGMADSPSDLKEMEQKSFGQFWQTVRSGPSVELGAKIAQLSDLMTQLRKKNPEKGAYGGSGWANYAASYFNDCDRFCRAAFRVMKPGGTAVIVIGNNILQGIEFPTDRFFAQIAAEAGFEVVELHEVRSKRTGNSILNSSVRSGTVRQRTKLYETAIQLRVPAAASMRVRYQQPPVPASL